VFHNKLKYYISNVANKSPDSLMVECDMLVDKSRANKEVFKYVVWYLTYYFETSKIMGYDAVFVHMVEKYYMTREAYWVNEKVIENITKRAMSLKPTLIGKTVPNLIMPDSTGYRWFSLYDIKANYIILYFWDPDCGHCRTQTPVLGKFYEDYKNKGVEVFAINTNNSKAKEWKKFIKEKELKFINVWDPQNQTNFRSIFDVSQTPVLFVLDSNFKIIAKKLSTEQLSDFIDKYMEYQAKEKEKNK
jgi:peroxiredoxin